MKITYEKQYTEQKFKHFTLYQNLSFSSTNVFWEYYNLIKKNPDATKEEVTSIVKNHKKESKSNLRINYTEQGLEFYKKDKYVFPEFYIVCEKESTGDVASIKREGVGCYKLGSIQPDKTYIITHLEGEEPKINEKHQ